MGMKKQTSNWCWWVLVLGLILFFSCQSKAPPLSQEAAKFAQEVKEAISSFTPDLVGPVSRKDVPAIKPHLEKFHAQEKPEGGWESSVSPFWIGADWLSLTIPRIRPSGTISRNTPPAPKHCRKNAWPRKGFTALRASSFMQFTPHSLTGTRSWVWRVSFWTRKK